jgi:hypothetical protein
MDPDAHDKNHISPSAYPPSARIVLFEKYIIIRYYTGV